MRSVLVASLVLLASLAQAQTPEAAATPAQAPAGAESSDKEVPPVQDVSPPGTPAQPVPACPAALPALLEPFAPLSPLVDAMFDNARATCLNGEGKRELARELFVDVLKKMDALSASELSYMDKVRAAIAQTITEIDASLGVDSEYIARLRDLDRDPNQGVGAHYIQKVVALHHGDWEAAERHRHDAELLSLLDQPAS